MKSTKAGSVIALQLVLTTIMSLLALVLSDGFAALSAVMGGGIAILGALLYIKVAYRTKFASPQVLMRAHFRAEMLKMFATALLFAVVFIGFKGVAAGWVIGSFAVATAAYWLVLVSIRKNG
ncbi:ATP synthase subunit I [Leeia sp. TBRC 13508]|uniref:ATP synthase subunit I n=1 Tax=Leeia speluncae TaxID=2884804 RepID=A0ABS8D328_9NEIS|nr:ATP synthase subunit I [Leeia speluncae]MCB6182589.1 ATP synthase subunit I [Leeia speluncae]